MRNHPLRTERGKGTVGRVAGQKHDRRCSEHLQSFEGANQHPRGARRTQLPLPRLRLVVWVFWCPRHVELVWLSLSTISVATTLLPLLLVGPLHDLHKPHPTVQLGDLVDDLALQKFWCADTVARELARSHPWTPDRRCEVATRNPRSLWHHGARASEFAKTAPAIRHEHVASRKESRH